MNKPLAHNLSYSESSVAIIRGLDRKRYRRGVIMLVAFQLAIAGPVRIAMDTLASHQVFRMAEAWNYAFYYRGGGVDLGVWDFKRVREEIIDG